MRIFALIIFMGVFYTSSVAAQEPDSTSINVKSLRACINKYSDDFKAMKKIPEKCTQVISEKCNSLDEYKNQQGYNLCASLESEAWDKILNEKYKETKSQLPENQLDLLKNSERNWLAYKNSQCDLEASSYEGGSIQPMIETQCQSKKMAQRIVELQEISQDR